MFEPCRKLWAWEHLKKRQELRQHLEEEQRQLRDRKKKLNSLSSLIDQRENLNETLNIDAHRSSVAPY